METNKKQNTSEIQWLLERYHYLQQLKQDVLTDLRTVITQEAYDDLILDTKKALCAQGMTEPDLPYIIVNDILSDQLERLLNTHKPNTDLITFLKGCTRKDFKAGIKYQKRNLKQPMHQNLDTTPPETILNQESLSPHETFEQNDSPTPKRDPDSLDQEILNAATRWANEDSKQTRTQETLITIYSAVLNKVKELLKNGTYPFTATGRLRLGKDFLKQLEQATNKTDKTIRTAIRQLEPRIQSLMD